MATVRGVLDEKADGVLTARPDESVLEAAKRMTEHRVGSLIVLGGECVSGIISERDIMRRVVVAGLDAADTPVERVMSCDVVCIRPDAPVSEAKNIMKERRIRHLPVVDDGALCGMISVGDLNAHELQEEAYTIHFLNEYIQGVR